MIKQAFRRFSLGAGKLPNYEETVYNRLKYLSPSLKTFEAYDTPVVLSHGEGQYIFDHEGKKYVDLLGQNLCVSVGYGHPTVVDAAVA